MHLVDFEDYVDVAEVTDAYWERAQRPLSTALTLAQQGAEFLLKARIATVSPFLLLSANPREWPSKCDSVNCAFADFRTIDAQDLGRVHDAVSPVRLSPEFKRAFEDMRKTRNSLMHSVTKGRRFSAASVITWILHVARELAGARRWPAYRRSYLEDGAPVGALAIAESLDAFRTKPESL